MDQSRLGPFLLSQRLGEDPAGTVFHAIHSEQRKPVALKVFRAPFATGPELGNDFAREWVAIKGLRHPNIVRCYGGGFEEMQSYLAYELVHGETLATVLARRGRLSWEQVVEYAMQIAAGLEAAHSLGIVHQALMPDKLLLAENGQLQIADFRVDRSNQTLYHTPAKRTLASVAYLAPEQLGREPRYSPKSDLYALGCIMFEMLSGQLPFSGEAPEEVVEKKLQSAAPRVATLVFDCPVWLDVLVSQLLEADPARRPHGPAAVSLALVETKRRVSAGTSVAEHAVSGLSPLKMQTDKAEARKVLGYKESRPRDRRPLHERPVILASGLGVLTVIAIGVLTWALWPLSERQMIAKADALMASTNKSDWEVASEYYLKPLLARFPNGEHAPRAQAHLDSIAMDLAERRLSANIKLRKDPKSEGERLYADALNFEQFGDRVSALDKYQSLVNLLEESGPDRPFVQLARRQIKKLLEDAESGDERTDFIKGRLAKADELAAKGNSVEAHKIWHSIVSLYSNNRELKSLVEQAQDRLAAKEPKEDGKEQ